MILALGVVVIAGAVYAVIRRVDVRLALLTAALVLGLLAGNLAPIVQKFLATLTSSDYLLPIGSAMGFSYVLRHTGCDQHLVHLLANPLRKVRVLLIPGTVLVGFIVNMPIISQTSSAVAIGSVLIPLLFAARISPVTAGAALLLGASIGGELFNRGAPEFRTVAAGISALGLDRPSEASLIRVVGPLNLLNLAVATSVFWFLSLRCEAAYARTAAKAQQETETDAGEEKFKVNLFKAAVPLVPLALLFLTSEPFSLLHVPHSWLIGDKESASLLQKAAEFLNEPAARGAVPGLFGARLIGAAMMVGVLLAAASDLRRAPGVAAAFFEGTGYALTHVISLIVAAACFGEGVKLIGLDQPVGMLVTRFPDLLQPAAGFLTLAFGFICGSGIAATQSMYGFFAEPAVQVGVAPEHVGAVVSLGAAAGRTMSPVAAVTLMCASLTQTNPTDLVRRVAPPLLVSITVVVLAGMLMVALGQRGIAAPPAEAPPAVSGTSAGSGV